MSLDVHSSEIRDEHLEAILFGVLNHTALFGLCLVAEALGAEKDTEFQRHVEARELAVSVQFGTRQIVYAVPALSDNAIELLYASLSGVIHLAGATSAKAAS